MVKSTKHTGNASIIHYRNRAAPRVALAKRTEEPVSSFFQRLAVVIHGSSEKFIRPCKVLEGVDKLPGSVEHSSTDVADQIRICLSLGSLTAIVKLSVAYKAGVSLFDDSDSSDRDGSADPNSSKAPIPTKNPFESARGLWESPPETDQSQPVLKTFTIRSTYWERDLRSLDLNWSTSTIELDPNFLDESDLDYPETRSVMDRYEGISGLNPIVFIKNPNEALRKVFSYAALPDDDWFSRYEKYRSEGRLEALAAGWRIIARMMKKAEPITANRLALLMDHYLAAQGQTLVGATPPAQDRKSSYIEMAKNMLAQLDAEDGNIPVLVSSNNHNPK